MCERGLSSRHEHSHLSQAQAKATHLSLRSTAVPTCMLTAVESPTAPAPNTATCLISLTQAKFTHLRVRSETRQTETVPKVCGSMISEKGTTRKDPEFSDNRVVTEQVLLSYLKTKAVVHICSSMHLVWLGISQREHSNLVWLGINRREQSDENNRPLDSGVRSTVVHV